MLVPWPGIKPEPPAVGAQSRNPWTSREVTSLCNLILHIAYFIRIFLLSLYTFPGILIVSALSSAFLITCSVYHACVLRGFSRVQLFVTLWTVARQAPLSTGFSRQEHGSGLPCSPPGDLPDPGIELVSLMSPPLAGGFFTITAASGTSLYLY